MRWNKIEHAIWSKLKKYRIEKQTLLVLVSGGLDSMALLQVLKRLRLKNLIEVAHFHHGPTDDLSSAQFRNEAAICVENFVQQVRASGLTHWRFSTARASKKLRTESEYREARRQFVEDLRRKHSESIVLTAHHQDDVLETRLLKLLRGGGVDSLSAFTEFNGRVFRPFVGFAKSSLRAYVMEHNVFWVEDPSNQSTDVLRNWIRHAWLPQLDRQQSGARHALARSLDLLSTTNNALSEPDSTRAQSAASSLGALGVLREMAQSDSILRFVIDRKKFKQLPRKAASSVLYSLFKRAQMTHYEILGGRESTVGLKNPQFWQITQSRIEEIYKRLDKNQKQICFVLGFLKALTSEKTIVLEFNMSGKEISE